MITVKKCTTDDLKDLQKISRETFYDLHVGLITETDMGAYLEKNFSDDNLRKEMLTGDSFFYFSYLDDHLAGYLRLNDHKAQTDIHDPQSMEIERIYVSSEFQRKGLGQSLMNQAIEIAKQHHKAYIWLGVWINNTKAIQFYEKNGFYVIGQHSFAVGDEEGIDYIMRKEIK